MSLLSIPNSAASSFFADPLASGGQGTNSIGTVPLSSEPMAELDLGSNELGLDSSFLAFLQAQQLNSQALPLAPVEAEKKLASDLVSELPKNNNVGSVAAQVESVIPSKIVAIPIYKNALSPKGLGLTEGLTLTDKEKLSKENLPQASLSNNKSALDIIKNSTQFVESEDQKKFELIDLQNLLQPNSETESSAFKNSLGEKVKTDQNSSIRMGDFKKVGSNNLPSEGLISARTQDLVENLLSVENSMPVDVGVVIKKEDNLDERNSGGSSIEKLQQGETLKIESASPLEKNRLMDVLSSTQDKDSQKILHVEMKNPKEIAKQDITTSNQNHKKNNDQTENNQISNLDLIPPPKMDSDFNKQLADVNKEITFNKLNANHRIIPQIIEKGTFLKLGDSTQYIVNLKPEHLGPLTVKLEKGPNGLSLSFESSNKEVRELLESNKADLSKQLSLQNIKLDFHSVAVPEKGDKNLSQFNLNTNNLNLNLNNSNSDYSKDVSFLNSNFNANTHLGGQNSNAFSNPNSRNANELFDDKNVVKNFSSLQSKMGGLTSNKYKTHNGRVSVSA